MTTRMPVSDTVSIPRSSVAVTVAVAGRGPRLLALDAELVARARAQVQHQRRVGLRALHHVVDRRMLAGIRVPVALRAAVVAAIGKRARAAGRTVVQCWNAVRVQLAS